MAPRTHAENPSIRRNARTMNVSRQWVMRALGMESTGARRRGHFRGQANEPDPALLKLTVAQDGAFPLPATRAPGAEDGRLLRPGSF